MTAASKTVSADAFSDALEHATDEAIAACDGDARATVSALIAENAALADQISRLTARVSSGYARGRVPGR